MEVVIKVKIKNKNSLLDHGDIKSREIVLKIAEQTLQSLDAYQRIKSIMSFNGKVLKIGKKNWDLSKKRNVYLIGAGKACNHMIRALEELLGARMTTGVVIVKILEEEDTNLKSEIFIGGHPLPNEEGLKASKRILELVHNATSDDLFIGVFSGGSSALMSLPVEGISLEDEQITSDRLLKSGANIQEINAVRRHISQMNGGRLAEKIQKTGAELIGFNISDSISLPPTNDITIPLTNMKGTPIGADPTTIEDALKVIKKYNLQEELPKSVINYLESCSQEDETPKSFPENTYYLLNTLPDSCEYSKQAAEKLGIPALILTTFLEGESKEAGIFFASIAKEIQQYKRPIAPPCVLLSAGETTTKIKANSVIKGHGGPSQELATSFAIAASGLKGVCMLSMDSEGTDGTSPAAGGITDSQSYEIAKKRGIDLFEELNVHATFEVLHEINDAIITGNTGTNVCDINILYVPINDEKERETK